jgi:hypothetical protein
LQEARFFGAWRSRHCSNSQVQADECAGRSKGRRIVRAHKISRTGGLY